MLKTIVMALLIFAGMICYDNFVDDQKPTVPPAKQEQQLPSTDTQQNDKADKNKEKAIKAIFFSLLPPKEEWPEPVQKFYIAMNMDEVIDPIRQRPDWTPLSAMSQDIPKALIAIEDHEFYSHDGVAVTSIARAMLVNMSAGEILQGGSTLTQQFVKNVFLNDQQTMSRKIEEAILSLVLESEYSKDEILELYLNTTYFGAGAYGIHDASRAYFAKAPSALTLAEAAVIAALPYAPSALNPLENTQDCKKRQQLVLGEMLKYGFINQGQLSEAKAEVIHLANGTTM